MPTVLPRDPSWINPEPTYHRASSEVHLPPGCPPLHPDLVADAAAVVSPDDETPETTSGGDMITLSLDDLTESIPLEEP